MVIVLSKKIQNLQPSKDIEKWSNRDHLIYFSNKYEEFTQHPFSIPRDAWIGLLARIKGFRTKLKVDNQNYKAFIDKVFDVFFTQDQYVPTFGTIVSEKVYYTVNKLIKNKTCSNSDFEQLKNQLYSSDLFKKLRD